MARDLYKKTQRLDAKLKKLKASEDPNTGVMFRYVDHCKARNLSDGRIYKYLVVLPRVSEMLGKPFEQATKEDIERVMAEVNRLKFSEWTRCDYRVLTKSFYKWLLGDGEEYPKCVKWLKTSPNGANGKTNEDILAEQDVIALVESCTSVRDKAFIMLLWDSGARVGELLNVKLRDVKLEGDAMRVLLDGKTGPRRVLVVPSVPFVLRLIEHHPRKQDTESYLFLSEGARSNGQPLTYNNARRIVAAAARRAGIRKRVHPHLMRHSRATHLAKRMTEQQMKQYFGWSGASKMAAVYVHMSGRDVDDAILKANGVEVPEDKPVTELAQRKCLRCHAINPFGSVACGTCGMPLTPEAVEKQKRLEEALEFFAYLKQTGQLDKLVRP